MTHLSAFTEPPLEKGVSARPAPRVGWIGAALTALFWMFNWAVVTISAAMDAVPDWPEKAGVRALVSIAGLGFCYAIHRVSDLLSGRSIWTRAAIAFLLSALAADGTAWLSALGQSHFLGGPPPRFTELTGAGLFAIAYYAWFFFAWSALYLALSYSLEVREQEQRWAELNVLAHQSQVRALTYQIRPHFLFNTLNSISAMVMERRIADAELMIRRLSEFLRESLSTDPAADIRLADELALQRLYLQIEQVRFPDLDVVLELPEPLTGAAVPA